MTGAVQTNSSDTVLAQVTYTYDALGNRIGIDDNGTETWTLYDGATPIMDFNSSGSLATRYLNGPAGDIVDEVLSRQSSSGTVAWYLPDRLGTIRDLINSSGSIIDHVDYSAFGTQLNESSPSNGDRMMGFAGMERDTVTGLNLAVYRTQEPGTGRWTSPDPEGFVAGDSNLYRYVGNGPNEFADPERQKKVVIPSIQDTTSWLAQSPDVQAAWDDSFKTKPCKEQGGWIYYNPDTKKYQIKRADPTRLYGRGIDLRNPPKPDNGFILIGDFHTHPFSNSAMGASPGDLNNRLPRDQNGNFNPRSKYPGYIIQRLTMCKPGDLTRQDIRPYNANGRMQGSGSRKPSIIEDPRTEE